MNFALALIANKIRSLFFTKKRIAGWVAAILLAIAAASSDMSVEDLKKAVADAPVLSLDENE